MNIIKQEILSNSLNKASTLFLFLPFSVLSFVDWGNFFWYFFNDGNKRYNFIDRFRNFSILCMTTKECKTKLRINNQFQNEQQNSFISGQF